MSVASPICVVPPSRDAVSSTMATNSSSVGQCVVPGRITSGPHATSPMIPPRAVHAADLLVVDVARVGHDPASDWSG